MKVLIAVLVLTVVLPLNARLLVSNFRSGKYSFTLNYIQGPHRSRSDPTSKCMNKFDVSWELKYGMWTLETLNRTTPEDIHKLGCVSRCKLQDTGKLQDDETIAEAYEKSARDSFERHNTFMRNNLDTKLKGIKKCAEDIKEIDMDECTYAYKMERCVEEHGVYVY